MGHSAAFLPLKSLRLVLFFINIYLSSGFKVDVTKPTQFKAVVETSIHHPIVDVSTTNSKRKVNEYVNDDERISVFDDATFSPFTPALDNIATFLSGKYQYIASSLMSAKKKAFFHDESSHVSPWEYMKEEQQHSPFTLNNLKQKVLSTIPPSKRFIPRNTFVPDDDPSEYWFHNKIHSFGNTGFLGAVHAACAPIATKLIDLLAYDRIDVRSVVSEELARIVNEKKKEKSTNEQNKNIAVLDLCCGIGMSTNALKDAFHHPKYKKEYDDVMVIGLDTSPEMIGTARAWTRHDIALKIVQKVSMKVTDTMENIISKDNLKSESMIFARGNAERTIFPDKSFNLVTIMYGFHEIPFIGRYRILREVRRVLKNGGTLALIDISPEYQPSATMLSGEPYVLEYQRNIETQMKNARGFTNLRYEVLIPGHVNMWLLERKASA